MRIDVVIPTFEPNADYLEQAIKSSGFANEIILVDDGNKKFDFDYFRSMNDYFFLTIISNEKNLGIYDSINRGIAYSSADWVSVISDDDFYTPEIIQIAKYVQNCDDYDIVAFPCENIGEIPAESRLFGTEANPTFEGNLQKNNIYGSIFFRRSLWKKLQGFKNITCGDWDFWNRALKSGARFKHFGVVGAKFRVLKDSTMRKEVEALGWDFIRDNLVKSAREWVC